jgi:small-conductance mechanosensitive channel
VAISLLAESKFDITGVIATSTVVTAMIAFAMQGVLADVISAVDAAR